MNQKRARLIIKQDNLLKGLPTNANPQSVNQGKGKKKKKLHKFVKFVGSCYTILDQKEDDKYICIQFIIKRLNDK